MNGIFLFKHGLKAIVYFSLICWIVIACFAFTQSAAIAGEKAAILCDESRPLHDKTTRYICTPHIQGLFKDKKSGFVSPGFFSDSNRPSQKIQTFFSENVAVEILPPLIPPDPNEPSMKDEPSVLGFSHNSQYLVCCYFKSADFETCEFIQLSTGGVQIETTEDTKYDFVREKRSNHASLVPSSEKRAAKWPYKDLRFKWHLEWQKGQDLNVLTIWIEHEPTKTNYPLDSVYVSGFESIDLQGIFISPDGRYLAIAYHTFAGEYTDRYPLFITSTTEVIGTVYKRVGTQFLSQQDWLNGLDMFRKSLALKPHQPNVAFGAAKAASYLGRKADVKHYLGLTKGKQRNDICADKAFEPFKGEPWFKRYKCQD